MNTFSEMELPEQLQQALDKIGFVEPTEIQQKSVPPLLAGKDLIACAETGSGKTGAYLIPMVKQLIEDPESQGMVLAPTRELAQQISEFLSSLIPNERMFHTTRLVGGQDIRKQFKSLQRKPRIIVATPGRLIDHLKRNTVQLNTTNVLVLDEGDRMIDMGFAPQLEQILKFLPAKRQTSFFTATIDEKVKKLAGKYLNNPVRLMINSSRPVSKIKQTVVQVELKDKDECIVHELNSRQGSVIVFLKTKHRTDRLTKYLGDYGFAVDVIHGGRTQGQRNRAISNFKKGKSRILCATDVAARGLDVPHVEHVINFDLPMQDEDYVHRVGRTARNGAEGEAVSFVTSHENRDWNRLVKKYEIPDALLEVIRGKGGGSGRPDRKRGPRSGGAGGRDGARAGGRKRRANESDGPQRRSKSARPRSEEGEFKKSSFKRRSDSDSTGSKGRAKSVRSRDDEGAGFKKSSFKKRSTKDGNSGWGSPAERSSSGERSFKKSGGKRFSRSSDGDGGEWSPKKTGGKSGFKKKAGSGQGKGFKKSGSSKKSGGFKKSSGPQKGRGSKIRTSARG